MFNGKRLKAQRLSRVGVVPNRCLFSGVRANLHLVYQVTFTISPASLENLKDRKAVPDFLVEGRLLSSVCSITRPFVGEITVVRADAPVKSIELQVRPPARPSVSPSPRLSVSPSARPRPVRALDAARHAHNRNPLSPTAPF